MRKHDATKTKIVFITEGVVKIGISATGRAKLKIAISHKDEDILYRYRSQSGYLSQTDYNDNLKIIKAIPTCCTKNKAYSTPLYTQDGALCQLATSEEAEKIVGMGRNVQCMMRRLKQRNKMSWPIQQVIMMILSIGASVIVFFVICILIFCVLQQILLNNCIRLDKQQMSFRIGEQ